MKVIMLKKVDGLGVANTIVEVRDGYATNFLIPNKLAVLATTSNQKVVEQIQRDISFKKEQKKKKMEQFGRLLKRKVFVIKVKVGSSGRAFGSLTSLQISKVINSELDDNNNKVTHNQIILDESIRDLGTYLVEVKLHENVKVKVTLELQQA